MFGGVPKKKIAGGPKNIYKYIFIYFLRRGGDRFGGDGSKKRFLGRRGAGGGGGVSRDTNKANICPLTRSLHNLRKWVFCDVTDTQKTQTLQIVY